MMNTDKIYAEQLANEYALKDTSKVLALRKLDARAKLPATVCGYTLGIASSLILAPECAWLWGKSAALPPVLLFWALLWDCWVWPAWVSITPYTKGS